MRVQKGIVSFHDTYVLLPGMREEKGKPEESMKHCGTVTLETDRLILRRFTVDDAEAMFNNWASDPEVTKYLMWPTHTSVDVSRSVLEDWVPHYAEDNYYQWTIVLKETGEPIGSMAVVGQNELFVIDYVFPK